MFKPFPLFGCMYSFLVCFLSVEVFVRMLLRTQPQTICKMFHVTVCIFFPLSLFTELDGNSTTVNFTKQDPEPLIKGNIVYTNSWLVLKVRGLWQTQGHSKFFLVLSLILGQDSFSIHGSVCFYRIGSSNDTISFLG